MKNRELYLFTLSLGLTISTLAAQGPGWQYDRNSDLGLLPNVPEGFEISFFAREPLVRQPGAMAFDAQGRLLVGMGPQYRNPKPNTPGDSVVFVLDTNDDGEADTTQTFATGFNCIQGLAWRGAELWVANAPDLTVVRDLDGDDIADEYVRLYTDLGNLEHGLHGLTWGPDGRLYMSKGNSKGLTEPGRVAPAAFRELWGVSAPPDTPDFPEPVKFTAENYQKNYHDPRDDWGREGGTLRCDPDGSNLEIISRGARNPWDIAMDDGFNWLGTDNDQTKGDQVFTPYPGARFGWNHPWSSHWGTESHPPTAPVSGPLFEGSGTGIIFGNSRVFPESHRGVFFINDWLNKMTYVWRPKWDGALLKSENGLEPFVVGAKSLFRPTDIEVGPDGALWILGWGSGYGAEYKDGKMTSEGRVFRVTYQGQTEMDANRSLRSAPLREWPVNDLIQEFDSHLPVRRINAQDELARRGDGIEPLFNVLSNADASERLKTWAIWTIGRMDLQETTIDDRLHSLFANQSNDLNLKIQALRVLVDRDRRSNRSRATPSAKIALTHGNARLRFEGVQAIRENGSPNALRVLLDCLATEKDPTVYYAGWQTLRGLIPKDEQRKLLQDDRPMIRRAALLALLEDNAVEWPVITKFAQDPSPRVREIAELRLSKGTNGETAVVQGRPLNKPVQPPTKPQARNWTAEPPRFPIVSDVRSRNNGAYRLVDNLRPGARPYTDRPYTLEVIPDSLLGASFIQTQNEDDEVAGNDWLSFTAHRPVRVIMGFDHRLPSPPRWARKQFKPTRETIRADHWTFHLHAAEFPAGRVTLGGNTDDGREGGKGMYIAVIDPMPLQPPNEPTTVESVLNVSAEGDPAAGRWLFHSQRGIGCFQCHQLEEHGNAYGPDLSNLVSRSTANHIAQSILDPNAVITEGYNQMIIKTAEESLSGILIEESGLSVSLGLVDGTRRTVAKTRIESRETSRDSAMPNYAPILGAQAVADLTAYLLQTDAPPLKDARATMKPTSVDTLFAFERENDRLSITRDGMALADYVFKDPTVMRPYFSNVHAPNGIQVTRNHPPIEGVDATDHATMHPGLWLTFGDLNGQDFWRNKATVKHVRFVREPNIEADELTYAVENHWLGADGSMIAREIVGFTFSVAELKGGTNGTVLIWDTSLQSDDHDLKLGHQEEMGLGLRMATNLTVKTGQGMILNSRGQRDERQVWGKTADWWSYGGKIGDAFVGTLVAPDNKFTPVSWGHARDYGALVINPTKPPPARHTFIGVNQGAALRLRYGILLFSNESNRDVDAGQLASALSSHLERTR